MGRDLVDFPSGAILDSWGSPVAIQDSNNLPGKLKLHLTFPDKLVYNQYLGKVPDKESFLAYRMALASQSGASSLTLALPGSNLDGILGLVGLVHALNTPFSLQNWSGMALL